MSLRWDRTGIMEHAVPASRRETPVRPPTPGSVAAGARYPVNELWETVRGYLDLLDARDGKEEEG